MFTLIDAFNYMVTLYAMLAFTHEYIFGFSRGNDVYMVFLHWNDFKRLLKPDRAAKSKGGMYKVRVKPDSKTLASLYQKAIKIGTIDELTQDKKHNRGENFERIITEKLCKEKWEKDSIPFTQAGDVVYNNIPYQIKFYGAELTNMKTIENFARV